jgi:type VI protein secretion system component VasF
MLRRLATVLCSLVLLSAPLLAQPPEPQGDFVPASSLPPSEKMAAAPLLIGSYAFFLVAMMFYLWTIWRRLGKVEQEMQELARRQAGSTR